MINVETYFAYLKCISILPVCTIANRKDRIHYLLKSYLFIINVIPLTYTKCISHYTIYIHKTYLIKSVCQMYLHLAIFRHRGQFLSSDSREAETAKIRKLDRTLNIIDLIYKPEHFLSLSLSLSLCRGIFLLYCGQISAGYITSCRRLSVAGCHHHVFYGGSRRGGKPEIKVTEPEIFLSGFVSSR